MANAMDKRETKIQQQVQEVLSKHLNDEAAQIDAIAEIRGWFRPDKDDDLFYSTIQAYLSGNLDLSSTIETIAEPIETTFTTANHGRAIIRAEETANDQRQYYESEEAEQRWGSPLPVSELPVVKAEDTNKPTAEGLLWNLYFSILHHAKRTPWRNEDTTQEKLLGLVKGLKQRQDPDEPSQMTKALRNDWVWSSNTVWSQLKMLGPSARESWNDSPGCGAGFSLPEQHAWANVNAFTARLTRDEVYDFSLYAIWAFRDALEDAHDDDISARQKEKLDSYVPAAAVWIFVLGKKLWEKEQDLTPTDQNMGNPAGGGKLWKGRAEFSKTRWALWKQRFRDMQEKQGISEETRKVAVEVFDRMNAIEHGSA